MTDTPQGTLTMNREKLVRLKRHYNACLERNHAQFTFEGHVFLADYAKYFIEYLETKFPGKEIK